tara:strand:+ start:1002 stop:1160 length:159 start_codon:yes stop_codon:yes gene_type:complete
MDVGNIGGEKEKHGGLRIRGCPNSGVRGKKYIRYNRRFLTVWALIRVLAGSG